MNLAEALLASVADQPDRVALRGPDVTYGRLAARAAAAGTRLAALGTPGDRIAIVAGNEQSFVVAYLAILLRGLVAVPLHVASPAYEIARELEQVTPKAIVASASYADLARRALTGNDASPALVVIDDDEEIAPVPPVPRVASDLAVLLFTAGTAGAPKPAMLTHGSLLANLEQMQSHPGLHVYPEDVTLGVLPLFHVYGLNVAVGLTLHAGGSVALGGTLPSRGDTRASARRRRHDHPRRACGLCRVALARRTQRATRLLRARAPLCVGRGAAHD